MTKQILLCMAACMAFGSMAEVQKNYVLNGSFDAPGATSAIPSGYTWAPWDEQYYLNNLPDWNLQTGGEWNGGIELKKGDDYTGDDETRPEDDDTFIHFLGYNDNGWTPIKILQKISDLKPGTEYTLVFALSAKWPAGSAWTPDPDYGFQFTEYDGLDDGGNIKQGAPIKSVNVADDSDYEISEDWSQLTYKLTPTASDCVLCFYYNNTWGTGNKADNKWMDLDCVVLVEGEYLGVDDIMAESSANTCTGVYNMQGVKVADNAEALGDAKGIFVVRNASGAKKIVR